MSNRLRGEVEAKGVDGTTYVFKLGSNAICILEEKLDKPVLSLFDELRQGQIRVTTLREFVKASFVGDALDDQAAGLCIDNVGLLPLLDAMRTSLTQTFNAPETADPPKPARRGGKRGAGSSSTPQK